MASCDESNYVVNRERRLRFFVTSAYDGVLKIGDIDKPLACGQTFTKNETSHTFKLRFESMDGECGKTTYVVVSYYDTCISYYSYYNIFMLL